MIGNRIKAARKLRGRSQKWLADEVGVKQPSVSEWESGQTDPTTDNMSAIARALAVNFEWLAKGDGPMESIEYTPVRVHIAEPTPPVNEELKELIDLFEKLPKKKRLVLLQFMRSWVEAK